MASKLSVQGVTSGYVKGIDIVNDVSLEIQEDAITGIIGPNGAGKSTLLKTIFGFLHPSQGKMVFNGQEIQTLSPFKLKQLGICYVPQDINTFPRLTVEENLMLGAWTFKRQRTLLKQRLGEIYDFFPVLGAKRGEKATFLSGGELQMLAIGKEVMTTPELLLVDEPSAGLAPMLVSEIYAFLERVREQGVTIFLVDQNITKAVEVSDYMYLLEMGKIKKQGPKEDFEENIRDIIKDSLIPE
ncbi:MAG: ABC transporter ATP-binding protein [Thermodesulfobacteriota bacterium]